MLQSFLHSHPICRAHIRRWLSDHVFVHGFVIRFSCFAVRRSDMPGDILRRFMPRSCCVVHSAPRPVLLQTCHHGRTVVSVTSTTAEYALRSLLVCSRFFNSKHYVILYRVCCVPHRWFAWSLHFLPRNHHYRYTFQTTALGRTSTNRGVDKIA